MLKARRIVTVPSGTNVKLIEHNDVFLVKHVKVDNYSGHWLRVDPDRVFVPPFTIGMLIDLFVLTQQVTVYADRPQSLQVISSTFEADGPAIISMYDDPVFPFPGTFINPPVVQRIPFADANLNGSGDIVQDIPSANAMMGFAYSLPLFWASAEGSSGESNNQIQARQLIDVFDAVQVCAAGVTTNIAGIVPDALHQRLMWLDISTDTASEITLDYSGTPVWHGFILASTPHFIPFESNGFNFNGSGASRFRANHVVGGKVALTVGMAKT